MQRQQQVSKPRRSSRSKTPQQQQQQMAAQHQTNLQNEAFQNRALALFPGAINPPPSKPKKPIPPPSTNVLRSASFPLTPAHTPTRNHNSHPLQQNQANGILDLYDPGMTDKINFAAVPGRHRSATTSTTRPIAPQSPTTHQYPFQMQPPVHRYSNGAEDELRHHTPHQQQASSPPSNPHARHARDTFM